MFLMGWVFLFSLIQNELPGDITFYFYATSMTLQIEDMLHFLIVKDKTTMLSFLHLVSFGIHFLCHISGEQWCFDERHWASLCGSAGEESACNVGDLHSISGLGRPPGEGKGYPLQYSGLENSMDCVVHGVANCRTQLSSFHFHFHCCPLQP